MPPKAELQWWYRFYFATERGRTAYAKYRHDFAKLIWQIASPEWNFDDATFVRSAASFDNPDHVSIVIHNYRWRILCVASGGQRLVFAYTVLLWQTPGIFDLAQPRQHLFILFINRCSFRHADKLDQVSVGTVKYYKRIRATLPAPMLAEGMQVFRFRD